jgi:hypothetical protein
MKKNKPDSTAGWQQCFDYQQAYMKHYLDGLQQWMHLQQHIMEDFNPLSQRKSEWYQTPWTKESSHFWSNTLQNNLNVYLEQFFSWNRQASNYASMYLPRMGYRI